MIFDIIKDICYRVFLSPERYARIIGVKIGENCLIATRNWSTEPYLVTIGNHVQLTNGVSIHTHGGAILLGRGFQILICLERWLLKIGHILELVHK